MYSNLIHRFQLSERAQLLSLSALIGVLTAVSIWLYHIGIDLFQTIFREWLAHDVLEALFGDFGLVIALALAGSFVGWLMKHFVGTERHHGVTGIIESCALTGGRLPYRKMPFKALASSLSLGAGASAGPEDPSVQIGANWGSWLGQRVRLSEEQVRLLVAAGAAGAIASAFSAPIAGVFFALEIVLNGLFTASAFGAVVLAAVVSAAVTQAVQSGASDAVGPLNYLLENPAEIILYLPLGILLAPFAAGFIHLVYWQRDLWHHHLDKRLPAPLKTALAGALVGLVGVALPQILGTGRETMNGVLSAELHLSVGLLMLLGIVKMLVTAISLAGGFIGGVFAPALFIGTMLGAAYGHIINFLFPQVDPQAFAIAGMAGMMAGVLRAPITAIMIVFELTNDYRLILPIMLTTIWCMIFSERMSRDSIYTLGLARAGIRLRQGMELDVMQTVTVGEVMHTPALVINENASLTELRDMLREQNTRALCVVNHDDKLVGIVTLRDLQRAFEREHDPTLPVSAICSRDIETASPSESVWTALNKMGARDVGRLPVLHPTTGELIGIFRRHNIIRAYNMMLTRRVEEQHHAEQLRLHTLTGAHVIEIRLTPQSPLVGKHISEIHWHGESVVAAIRRRGKLIIPHGDTLLLTDDVLTIVAEPEAEEELYTVAEE
jgi:CIC family chloride channel protein